MIANDDKAIAADVSSFGAIASGHPATTKVAKQVLENGGNAYDAIIAATLVACAAEPVLASLGGGGFFLGKSNNQNARCLDFFTHSPLKNSNDCKDTEKITVQFSSTTQDFFIGTATTATPGVVKGLFEIHKHYGHMPIKELFSYSSSIIQKGISTTKAQHNVLQLVKKIYLHTNNSRNIYQSKDNIGSDEILQTGEILKNSDLSKTIEAIAHEGSDLFYKGEIADKITQLMSYYHGSLTKQDLQNYQAIWREPLHYSLSKNNQKLEIYSNSSPALGGLYLKSLLLQYQRDFLAKNLDTSSSKQWNTDSHYQKLVEHQAKIFQAYPIIANFNLGDNDTTDLQSIFQSRKLAPKGTTHISIIDKQENVAAITLSNGEGNGYIIPDTGIMLNNMLGEEDVNPLAPSSWVCNQRLSSMMAPTIGIENNTLFCLGTGGSNRIPSALAQTLIQLFFYDKPIKDAVDFPRIHFDKNINIEVPISSMDSTKYINKLAENIAPSFDLTSVFGDRHNTNLNVFKSCDFYFGGVNIVQLTNNDELHAYSDLRRID